MKKITVNNYQKDSHYPKVVSATGKILETNDFVSPIGVFKAMNLLQQSHIDAWRNGRVSYLEKVICGNLAKASRILRILKFHAHDLNLMPSHTIYQCSTKNGKIRLRFSKSGEPNLEVAYSQHFVKPRIEKPLKSSVPNL